MACVVIQKRKTKRGISYVITYRDPETFGSKYFKTCYKYKEAQFEANNLRGLIDSGKPPKAEAESVKPLTFGEIGEYLKKVWVARFNFFADISVEQILF